MGACRREARVGARLPGKSPPFSIFGGRFPIFSPFGGLFATFFSFWGGLSQFFSDLGDLFWACPPHENFCGLPDKYGIISP